MELDYAEIIKLVRVRRKQIEDIALEEECFNTEYTLLQRMETELALLIRNERKK